MIDSHTHVDLTIERLSKPAKDILENAAENGISAIVQIAGDEKSYEFSRKLAHEKHPVNVFYTIGLHPGEAHEVDVQKGIDFAKKHASDERFVAIGEIGLEYYYAGEHKEKQIEVFKKYLNIAGELKKPVTIHTRDAFDDTLQILDEYAGQFDVLIHCFTGTEKEMHMYTDRGFYISYSGIVTFKNAKEIQNAAKNTPTDRILIETDAPYLTPVPFRGKINEPAYVKHTLEFISRLRDVHPDELEKQITANTERFYRL